MKTVAAFALLALGAVPAWAQTIFVDNANAVPTLDEGGLVALVALVGAVGAFVARRRYKK